MQTGQFWQNILRKCWAVLKTRRRCITVLLVLNGGLWGIPALYMALFTPAKPALNLPSFQQLHQSTYDLYVVNWGFHTAIILEQPDGWRLGPQNHPQARYVEYGWGDKRFFMYSDTSILTTLAAGVLPTSSVMYLRGRDQLPTAKNQARQLYYRQVTRQQLYELIKVLEQSFLRQDGNRVEPYPNVPTFAGQFYPGREYYVIWSDCNAWTVRHLQDIDVAYSVIPVILSEQVGPSLKGFQLIQGTE